MLTAEEQGKERSVFDDDDDDAEDNYDDDSDDDDEDAAAAGHPAPTTPQPSASQPLGAAAPQRAGLNSSAAPSPNFTPNPNPAPISNHNPSAAPYDPAGPLNGATPVVTIPIAAAPALSSEPASTFAAVVTATLEERDVRRDAFSGRMSFRERERGALVLSEFEREVERSGARDLTGCGMDFQRLRKKFFGLQIQEVT